jgi:hypothetical protein
VPSAGFGVGNVAVFGSVGGDVRLGLNLSGFPQQTITPANAPDLSDGPKAVEAYVFVGGQGRAVIHNIFLDGNVFVDGPEIAIDPEPFVVDLKTGFAVRYKAWRLDYTFVRRSEEFEPPIGRGTGDHEFGSVALSYVLWQERGAD